MSVGTGRGRFRAAGPAESAGPPLTPWIPPRSQPLPLAAPVNCRIINVPPVFMFQAKIFQPPRLCAIYKRK